MGVVYVIAHVIIDPRVPVPQWPLSCRGIERMRKLLDQPWTEGITSIYCSAEQKAIDGAEILARHRTLGYDIIEELGEIDRSATGYLPHGEHLATSRMCFDHPETSISRWETASDAQRRIVQAVERIVEGDPGRGNIAIVSHGAVATLYLCHLQHCPISRTQIPPGRNGGNYYCFERQSKALVHGWRLIDG